MLGPEAQLACERNLHRIQQAPEQYKLYCMYSAAVRLCPPINQQPANTMLAAGVIDTVPPPRLQADHVPDCLSSLWHTLTQHFVGKWGDREVG
jgi:hypothetical protein